MTKTVEQFRRHKQEKPNKLLQAKAKAKAMMKKSFSMTYLQTKAVMTKRSSVK